MAAHIEISDEDQLRAGWYALLAQLLSREPNEACLQMLRGLEGDTSDLGSGIKALSAAARGITADTAKQEYFDLFIGIGQGELLPYASYYLTGFLHEKPLARLRGDMAKLQIERADEVSEPEDHIAALCEMMAGLITGGFGQPADLAVQRDFFDTHIGCWAPRFFEDLQAAQSAVLYMPVGTIGRQFLAIESQAFDMAA
jgi:TorA maturation chaperone TorD